MGSLKNSTSDAERRGNPGSALASLLPPEVLELVAGRFRVLSSPSRLRILDALMQGSRSMGELSELTGLEQSNLSRHVATLERDGCVARRREGLQVYVDVVDPSLKPLCELVCGGLKA
jgi:DNA-binding transcriptional ArsR family regulator